MNKVACKYKGEIYWLVDHKGNRVKIQARYPKWKRWSWFRTTYVNYKWVDKKQIESIRVCFDWAGVFFQSDNIDAINLRLYINAWS